jgi:methylmalonyl-CoA/ethylmalonyl-CoA epimerase
LADLWVSSCHDLLVGEPFTLKVAWARLGTGPLVVELLQPVEGRLAYAQFLETKGEGVHHIAFSVSNWGEMVSKFREQGGDDIR